MVNVETSATTSASLRQRVEHPNPLQPLLAATCFLARSGPARSVFTPIWAAYPAIAFGDRDALPELRSDAAIRMLGQARPARWNRDIPLPRRRKRPRRARELDKLQAAEERGRGLRCDKRSRLPDAIEMLLRSPVLTPKALAAELNIAPQTATALLRGLQAKGLVREVTGRGSFRAFAL